MSNPLRTLLGCLVLSACLLPGCGVVGRLPFGADAEPVAVEALPEAVVRTAIVAIQGFEIDGATVRPRAGQDVYALEGVAGGQRYQLEITAEGRLLGLDRR